MIVNAVTSAYNDFCRNGDALAQAVRRVERSPSLLNNGHACTLSRPLFVEEHEIRGFADDLHRMLELLISLPHRLFDGDLPRFFDALGLEHGVGDLMSRLGGEALQLVGRADVYHDGTGFKILEFGIGSELGGWAFGGDVPRAMVEDDAFGRFAAERGLSYVDTGQELADALRQATAAAGLGDDPVVALVEAPGALAMWGNNWGLLQEAMQKRGIDFRIGELDDVTERDGRICLAGDPVDMVYRAFEAGDLWARPEVIPVTDAICRAHAEGRVVLWTPTEANLFGEKGCLALLSDPYWSSCFTADERALVDRVLPWTRLLNAGTVPDIQALVDDCRNRRTELILKPSSMYGGIGVVAGWEVDHQEWWAALCKGVSEGAIIQERVVPRADVVVNPVTGEDEEWRSLWGVFYTPKGYAGSRCWMVPSTGRAVIGLDYGKEVLAAGVFQYDAGNRGTAG